MSERISERLKRISTEAEGFLVVARKASADCYSGNPVPAIWYQWDWLASRATEILSITIDMQGELREHPDMDLDI